MRLLRVFALVLVACLILGLSRVHAQPSERPAGRPEGAPSASGGAVGAPDRPRADGSGAAAPAGSAKGGAGKAGSGAAGEVVGARPGDAKAVNAAADPKAADLKAADPKATGTKPADSALPEKKATPAGANGGRPSSAGVNEVLDGSTYVVRMRDLAQRVDELKEQIRRSHTRLSLLSDTILSGGGGGARAEIRFGNELSSAFRLTRLLVVLDGAVQYNRQDDTGALAKQREIPIFSGSIPAGDHTLQVLVKLQGYGYGVFSYLRGYHFEYKSSTSFTVTAGKTIELRAIAMEKGSVTTPLEERPSMRFIQNIRETGSGDEAPRASGASVMGPGANRR